MLHKNPSKRSALLKYGLSAPLFGLMLIFTSATISKQKTILKLSDNMSSDAPIKEVAVDLSHQINIVPTLSAKTNAVVNAAQKLKGKVVNPFGKPLANVKVYHKKINFYTKTDEDGDFEIPEYTEGDIVNFTTADSTILVRMFTHVAGKLQIVVIEDKRWTENRAKMLIVKQPSGSDVVSFASVEKLPTFPGGEVAFGNYLAKNIRYPKEARDQKITGRVIVSFIVEKDGKLNDIKVLRDIGAGCGAEAVRVLSESPAWNPGIQNGKPVRVAYTMPVNFALAGDDSNKTLNGNAEKSTNVSGNVDLDTVKTYNTFSTVIHHPGEKIQIDKALIIIDGVEAKGTDPLNNINPNNIESISVLKDNSAITKYGDKGKDGVIEITTKKAKKP
ncbi:MAG: TonB family protein [Sphingobacteriaceae bacterium]|nr:MAG: TonB family protein [Sphingobacteriaceae bacterium]